MPGASRQQRQADLGLRAVAMRLPSRGKPPASLKADCTAAKETVLHCLLPRASPCSAVSACSCCPSAPCHTQHFIQSARGAAVGAGGLGS